MMLTVKPKTKTVMNRLKRIIRPFLTAAPVVLISLVMATNAFTAPHVFADQFDAQINALNQDSSAKRADVAQLGSEAASLTDTITKLQAQIDVLQTQINANKAKQADLQTKIDQAQQDLDTQKKLLGADIKQMYVDGQISTLEMLASSKDLSDFVDKQQYRNSVQNKIKDTLDKITALKLQLKQQKDEVEKLLVDQQAMQDQVASQQAQQNQLLSANVDQQNSLNSQIKQNSQQVAALRAQQAAANARLFSGANVVLGGACDTSHGDTYPSPWCSASQDSMIDSWGMFNRECVSYTAWKVAESGRYMPYWGGQGNANQWDDDARAAGIPVDTTPRAGDVAIKNSGPYGHAMYVESVNGDGTINISQYNANLNGQFSRVYNLNPAPLGLVFIHF